MVEEDKRDEAESPSEDDVESSGSVTVDEPTDTSLEPHNDEAFRDGVPEPGQGKDDSSDD